MYWDDDFAFEEYDTTGWSIWAELRDVVAQWEGTYRDYWALGKKRGGHLTEEQARDAKSSHAIAQAMLRMIKALTIAGAADQGKAINLTTSNLKWIRKVLRAQKDSAVVSDWIGLELAKDFVAQIDGASDRAFRLLGVLQGRTISDRSASYLSRVSTLYLQGLELETGVMCRAALEAALASRLEEEIDADGFPPGLDELLRVAGETGLLEGYEETRSRRGWRARTGSPLYRADRIRRAGNFIIHDFLSYPQEAGAIKDGFECIRELTLVLLVLFPPPAFE